MKNILSTNKLDRTAIFLITISIIFTSLVWIGDIISWSWLGNGFLIDIILFIIAILLTILTVYLTQKLKRNKQDLDILFENETIKSDEIETIFTCFNCGEILLDKEGLCPVCGSPKPVCAVCFSELTNKDEVVKLPCCSLYAHKLHILNYLEIKGQCPKCQQILFKEDLETVHF
ncbi:MAG: hypothetical protein JXA54_08605 [Candidatus Heimdallarchaeota archaeon]|nr:hypothetical protein [Candidatus Heimdallarchaeota archaeon]